MTRKSRIHFPDVLTCAEHYSFGGTQVGGRRVSRIERIDYKLACEPYIVYFCGIFDNAVSTTHHPIQHLIIHLSIIINEYQNFVKLNGIFKVLHEKNRKLLACVEERLRYFFLPCIYIYFPRINIPSATESENTST